MLRVSLLATGHCPGIYTGIAQRPAQGIVGSRLLSSVSVRGLFPPRQLTFPGTSKELPQLRAVNTDRGPWMWEKRKCLCAPALQMTRDAQTLSTYNDTHALQLCAERDLSEGENILDEWQLWRNHWKCLRTWCPVRLGRLDPLVALSSSGLRLVDFSKAIRFFFSLSQNNSKKTNGHYLLEWMKRIQFLLELVLECAKHWTALLLSWALSACDARLLCTLSNSLHLLPYSALRTGDQGHGLATSFPNEWSFFFSLFCLYEDGGVLLLRELSVSLWRGLPPYNGIKFKFKCGRDVKSTVGKKIGDCKSTGGD